MIKTNPLSVKDIEKIAHLLREHFNVKKDEFFPVLEIIDKLFENGYLSYQIIDDDTNMIDKNTLAIYNPKENFIYIKESVINEYEEGIYRSTFTLCNEFFHYIQNVMLKFNFEKVDVCKSYEEIDWQANEFAGQILIPTEFIDYDEEFLQKQFHVSLECVLTRKAKCKKRQKK